MPVPRSMRSAVPKTKWPEFLRPNRGWLLGAAGVVAAYIVGKLDAPLWLAGAVLLILVLAAGLHPWMIKKKARHVVFWIVLSICVIGAVARTVESRKVQGDHLEHTHVQWIGPQSVADYHLLPLKPGDVQLGFGISNVGDAALSGGQMGVAIGVVPKALVPAMFSSAYRDIRHRDTIGTMVAHPARVESESYATYPVHLTKDDVTKLKSGEKQLCGVGSVIWSDPSGTYETYMYRCMFVQPDGTFNWNVEAEDNTEHEYQVH